MKTVKPTGNNFVAVFISKYPGLLHNQLLRFFVFAACIFFLNSCKKERADSDIAKEGAAHHETVKAAIAKRIPTGDADKDYVSTGNYELDQKYPQHHALSEETLGDIFTEAKQIGKRKFIEPTNFNYYEYNTWGWEHKRETFQRESMDYYKRYIFYKAPNFSLIKLIVEDVGYSPAWKIALEWNLLTEQKSDSAIYVTQLYRDFAEAGPITKVRSPAKSLIWYAAEPGFSNKGSWIYRSIFNNQLILTAISSSKVDDSEFTEFIDKAFDTEMMKRIEALKPAQ